MSVWVYILIFQLSWRIYSTAENRSAVASLIISLQQKYCVDRSCKTSNSTQEMYPPFSCPPCYECSCEKDCVIFGDCCPDLHIGPSHYSFQCLDIPFMTGRKERYFILKTCSQTDTNYSEVLAEKCHNFRLDPTGDYLTTATVTSAAGVTANITFGNRFCAECHGVGDSVPWNIMVDCAVTPQSSDVINVEEFLKWATEACSVGFVPPPQFRHGIRRCKVLESELISSCNRTASPGVYNETIAQACSAYYNPLIQGKYRNMFCYLCSGQAERDLQFLVECDEAVRWSVQPFSAILNFEAVQKSKAQTNKCMDDDFEDSISKVCRKILCPSLQQWKGGNCRYFIDSAKGILIKMDMIMIPLSLLEMELFLFDKTLINAVREKIPWDFYVLKISVQLALQPEKVDNPRNDYYNKTTTTTLPMPDTYTVVFVKVSIIVTAASPVSMSKTKKSLLDFQYEKFTVGIRRFAALPSVYFDIQSLNLSVSPNMLETDTFEDDGIQMLSTAAILDIPYPYLQCPHVEFKDDEYERLPNGSLLVVPDSLYVYDPHFEITNSSKLRVCVDHLRHQIDQKKPLNSKDRNDVLNLNLSDRTITTVTAVFLGLSLLCLFLTFLTHCLFADLRTLPGINLMFLTSSLFVSQALYLFGAGATDDEFICRIIGIVIHYSWLVTFAWMNVCSFHVFRVFKNLFSALGFNDKKITIIVRYALFSYIVPGVIVVLNILIHYYVLHQQSLGYSEGGNICFITSGLASVLSFGIPAGLTVLMSSVFFIYTCVVLHKTSKERQTVGKKESIPVFRFFKLTSITGLSWLFGFLGSVLKVEILAYVFIILAGGQGLLVFLSFTCTKIVWKKCTACICQVRRKKETENLSHFTSGAVDSSSTEQTMT